MQSVKNNNPRLSKFEKPVSKKLRKTKDFVKEAKVATERAAKLAESLDQNILTSFSSILDGYGDLQEDLNPENPESEVDKVVKFILDQNILVRSINVEIAYITSKDSKLLKKITHLGSLIMGRYTPGELGEDALILKRWNELITNVPVLDPFKCMKDFSLLQSSNVKKKLMRKKNVLGCYLSQDLTKVRHASDVFYHTFDLLNTPISKGKFTKEEDQIIVSEVGKSGECKETWKKLAERLNRLTQGNCIALKTRFILLTKNKFLKKGHFDITEDEFILRGLFGGKKNADIQEIESITQKDFTDIAESLNRSVSSVSLKWKGSLKPILSSHHFGTLHRPWKEELFKHLICKQVIARQDINYRELKAILPEQNPTSIKTAIINYESNYSNKCVPLWKRIEESCIKDVQEREKIKNYREKIVDIYERVKNE